ncbi:MAG: pilus assembly protein [Deltaproteobacteria bacterium]|nr:pilus assembly protein [Deltaproteobacteria bacterium]
MHDRRVLGGGEQGQVIVEQAIILPMMVFLILGIVQLSMLQHARIATEYAAYNAARSGIVYNGDVDKMERAAFFSVLPTLGRSDNWGDLFQTVFSKALLAQFGADLADMIGFDILGSMKMVQVEILDHPDPNIGDRLGIVDQQQHLNQQQIDFDDFRTQPAIANQLTVQVKYFYKMRIPFANWMLHYMWMASRADAMAAYGTVAFANPERTILGRRTGIGSHTEILARAAAKSGDDDDLRVVLQYRVAGEYRIPINTHYTMRMQSNLYRTYLEGN